uniref:Uncharacterized protein n=1 Tax=Ananas comosus var. bracteatus TaxID=296719 RepID=A0A6V7QKY7_ANACO|nr:unnamed protein product [Ananas comosus var. bracteatus]
MLTSSLRSRMADSSIPSAPSVQVLDGWWYLLSPLDHPLGCQRAWLAGWTRHAIVLPPWQAVSSLLAASSVRASAGMAGGMDASYLPSSVSVGSDGLISVYVEVEIPRGDSIVETVRIWGSPFLDADQSEEDAARRPVAKLRDEYAFEVKDANLEDKKFYENLYTRLSVDHTVVCEKYKHLKIDYNLLKGYYNDLMSEKELLIAERRELIGNIEKCSEVFRRPSIRAVRPASSGDGSGEDPATHSGYRD